MPVGGARFPLQLYPLLIISTIGQRGSRKFVLAADFCKRAQPTRLYSSMEQSNHHSESIMKKIQSFIPPLTFEQHKGQYGRIGIIGGSEEYTGAPYFAAISALKLGADLAHVFCRMAAGPAIKSYSPELIVHPILDNVEARKEFQKWMPRLHTVVIGPGLGQFRDNDQHVLQTVEGIVQDLKQEGKPLVIDADGLLLVTNKLDLIRGYKNAILTPNAIEFKRLVDAIGNISGTSQDEHKLTIAASQALGGPVIARKLRHDLISDGNSILEVVAKGSPRRCGGQGDLLSGAAAVFFHWALLHESKNLRASQFSEYEPGVLSAYAACLLSKLCAEAAFQKNGRSTTTSDLINEIHLVFDKYFEHPPNYNFKL